MTAAPPTLPCGGHARTLVDSEANI